jgi:ankyrin repeat protein
MNRTPLHIAAGTRADLSTIQLLVNASPSSCSIRDVNGMTPLHLACKSTCEIYTGNEEDCTRDPPTCDVISTLLKAYPTAVTLEDKEGTSALEHAILSGAPVDVVNLLQTITCQQNQMKAHQIQMKAHEDQMKAQQEMNIVSFTTSRRVRYERQLAQRWLINQMNAHQSQMKAHEDQMKAQQEMNIVSFTTSRQVKYERQLAQWWLINNAVKRDVQNLNDTASL